MDKQGELRAGFDARFAPFTLAGTLGGMEGLGADILRAVAQKTGLRIVAQKRVHWTAAQAGKFYEEHKARPFYGELVKFMTSGPIVMQVLEGDNAIAKYRDVMGATDPKEAKDGTIRKLFALSKGENSTHGSDSPAGKTPHPIS